MLLTFISKYRSHFLYAPTRIKVIFIETLSDRTILQLINSISSSILMIKRIYFVIFSEIMDWKLDIFKKSAGSTIGPARDQAMQELLLSRFRLARRLLANSLLIHLTAT